MFLVLSHCLGSYLQDTNKKLTAIALKLYFNVSKHPHTDNYDVMCFILQLLLCKEFHHQRETIY